MSTSVPTSLRPGEQMTDEALARKNTPVWSGFVDYFPLAMQEVARLSWVGNEQHNPGTELHWDREKSGDERDAMMRHLIDAGTIDSDGVRHSTKAAWRAMANLEKELEDAEEVACDPLPPYDMPSEAQEAETSLDEPSAKNGWKMTRPIAYDDACDGHGMPEGKDIRNPGLDYTDAPVDAEGWHCPRCAYLENKIDRHECRDHNETRKNFYAYLHNYQQYFHFMRWEIQRLRRDKV